MLDYDKINHILESDLQDVRIDDLIYIQRIVKTVLRNVRTSISKQFRCSISVYDSLKLVYKFLDEINPNYAKKFRKDLDDGTISMDYGFDIGLSYVDMNLEKRILIPIHHDIHDSFVMVHEFMHDMNLKVDSTSVSRHLFTETFSILGEMLFHDYLIKNNKYVHDANIHMNDVFSSASRINMKNDFEINLYLNYLMYGNINSPMLNDLIYDDFEYSWQVYYSLTDALKNGTFALDYDQRYSIGILFASYMYERIVTDPKKIYELWDLNDIINEISIQSLMHYLDLDLEENNDTILTMNSIMQLEKTYQKVMKKIG